ncbi:hypothetical protein K1719_034110 [Acacia pycnantha]|nr:hypothetical protein K1719_034110 [Acacia pycnantha]
MTQEWYKLQPNNIITNRKDTALHKNKCQESGTLTISKRPSIFPYSIANQATKKQRGDDEFGHLPRTDDYVDKLGEVHDKSQVDDIGGIEAIQLNHHDGHDSDSDDGGYMEHSESGSECRDSEERLIDDDEMHEDPEDRSSDEDEDRSSDEDEFNSNAPPQERVKRRESDGSEKRTSFRAGMTFLDRRDHTSSLSLNFVRRPRRKTP